MDFSTNSCRDFFFRDPIRITSVILPGISVSTSTGNPLKISLGVCVAIDPGNHYGNAFGGVASIPTDIITVLWMNKLLLGLILKILS